MSSPGFVAGVAGGGSEDLASTVRMPDFDVILLPAQPFAQHSVRFVQLHKLAVQRRVGEVAVWVKLQGERYSNEVQGPNQTLSQGYILTHVDIYTSEHVFLHFRHTLFSVKQMYSTMLFLSNGELISTLNYDRATR